MLTTADLAAVIAELGLRTVIVSAGRGEGWPEPADRDAAAVAFGQLSSGSTAARYEIPNGIRS